MKKQLLSYLFGAFALSASAQMNQAGDGFTLDNTDAASNCYLNCCTSGGVRTHGGNFDSGSEYLPSTGHLTLTTGTAGAWNTSPAWFDIPTVVGEGESAQCSNLKSNTGINMSSNANLTVTVNASGAGDLYVWLGSGGDWSPTSSTYDIADGSWGNIPVKISFTEAGEKTESFDLNALDANVWSAWSGNSSIEAIGFASDAESVTFKVKSVLFGADADSNNNGGGDNGGGDNGGGNGETNGEACASTTDDGQAEATFYNLIADGLSTTVTCQYDVLRDVKGTKYGALETATLQGESPAKYCGMCVEMTGAKGTDIVRVVDECPDCWEHNSGDTDIDLSPSAFEAIVGEESIGRSSITWKEVSCPWSSPISLMIESGHQWSIQLIVENEVNRIASVEISSDGGSNWDAMERTVANQWSRGSMSGETKDFRITDIYGSVITMSGLDFSTTLSWHRFDGTENFPACGLVSSEKIQNDLDFVNVFPNPANTSITFEGMKEAISIEIVNINGKVVASKTLNNQYAQVSLDVSGLANGLYVAKMNGSYGFSTKTFVKK